MLRRITIGFVIMVAALVVIDRISLLFAPCSVYSGEQNNKNPSTQNECALREGVVVAGIERLLQTAPEAWTAIASVAIAAFTLTLWLSSEKMWRVTRQSVVMGRRSANAARKSADLARDEFIASHRPLFIIHSLDLLDTVQMTDHDSDDVSENPLRVRFVIINAGTSAGTIVSSAVHLRHCEDHEKPWRNRPQHNCWITRGRYTVGMADTVEITGLEDSGLSEASSEISMRKLYFFGWILYEDDAGLRRTTYFCRRYEDLLERFAPIEDPEANQTY